MARHAGDGRAGGELLERFVRFGQFMKFKRFNKFNGFKRLGFLGGVENIQPSQKFGVWCLALNNQTRTKSNLASRINNLK